MYVADKLQGLREVHRVLNIGGTAIIEVEGFFKESETLTDPPLEELIQTYPNDNQLLLETVEIHDGQYGFYAIPQHSAHRVTVNKKTEEALKFQQFLDWKSNRKLSVTSFYSGAAQ